MPPQSQLQPRLRVLRGRTRVFGPGKAELLRAIVVAGSIRSAAARLDMSYNRAWTLVRTMNGHFRGPVVAIARGGGAGGGATLTPLGRRILECYTGLERACLTATRAEWRILQSLLAPR